MTLSQKQFYLGNNPFEILEFEQLQCNISYDTLISAWPAVGWSFSGFYIYYLELVGAALIGIGYKDSYFKHVFLIVSSVVGIYPCYFYFYNVCCPTPWIFYLVGITSVSLKNTLLVFMTCFYMLAFSLCISCVY